VTAVSTSGYETTEWRPSRKLSKREQVVLAAEIVATYARVRYVLLRRRALPDVLEVLRRSPRSVRPDGWRTPYEAGVRLGHAVIRTLTVLPTDSRCLMRSLVLTVLLNRRGIATDLVIGVRTLDDEFGAHAWVELDGRPLLPPGADFMRLGEF
jgi:hypothetical protein